MTASMASRWNFSLIDMPTLPIPGGCKFEASSPSGDPTGASQPPPGGAGSPPPQVNFTQPPVTYDRIHLLGLPGEVRLSIWRAIHDDILLGSEELWFHHPSTAWDGLQLTCQQIHLEIAHFWPLAIVSQAQVDKAFTQVLSIDIIKNFRRLSLELPFNKGKAFYESLALTLGGLASTLEDLRLYFVGEDHFNIKSFVHGCGLRDSRKETSMTKLAIDGQYERERKALFMALYFLQRLRTLVINNANYPLLQSLIIKHKPQLEYLHISTDPRSCLHSKLDLGNQKQLITTPKDNFPPIKRLHISTNAALTALQVAAKVARTIEELNWTVTDVAIQHYTWPWLEQTTVLLDHFGTYAAKLRTLRLCFHAPIYEGHFSEGTIIGGLKQHLRRLTTLECLELHIHSKADFSGAEIIFSIPDSVRRLFISDKLISAEKLEKIITERYLWSGSKPPAPFPGDLSLLNITINDNFTTVPVRTTAPNPVVSQVGTRLASYVTQNIRNYRARDQESCRDDIIGENRKRIDHIPFRHGKLGFIGYEYDGHQECCECNMCDESKLSMLRLNGRLLDRERNSHLAVLFDDGSHIWPRTNHADAGPSNMNTNGRKSLGEDMISELEVLDTITEKWDADPMNRFGGYFGMEEQAAGIFAREIGVAGEELPERKWPEEAVVAEKEHWLSEA